MKKQLIEYINGNVNVVQDEFILSRERSGRSELIFVNTPGSEKPMYALWNSKKDAKAHKLKKIEKEYTIEQATPKGTGGELAYLMVMLRELESTSKLSIEASGLLLKLFSCVEWNTCRVVRKRDGAALTQQMMSEKFKIGTRKLKQAIAELREMKILRYEGRAYYMNKALIRKGRSQCESNLKKE